MKIGRCNSDIAIERLIRELIGLLLLVSHMRTRVVFRCITPFQSQIWVYCCLLMLLGCLTLEWFLCSRWVLFFLGFGPVLLPKIKKTIDKSHFDKDPSKYNILYKYNFKFKYLSPAIKYRSHIREGNVLLILWSSQSSTAANIKAVSTCYLKIQRPICSPKVTAYFSLTHSQTLCDQIQDPRTHQVTA